MKGGIVRRPPTPPVAEGSCHPYVAFVPPPPPPPSRPYITVAADRIPFQESYNQTKRPASRDTYPEPIKKVKMNDREYENITPTCPTTEPQESATTTTVTDFYHELFTPL